MTPAHKCSQERRIGVVEEKIDKIDEKENTLSSGQAVMMEKIVNLVETTGRIEKTLLDYIEQSKKDFARKEELEYVDQKINDFRDQYRRTLWYVVPAIIASLAATAWALFNKLFLKGN